jgi:broad specificity phosphatase PhoE
MRVVLATCVESAESQDRVPAGELALAMADEIRRQVLSRGSIAGSYAAPQAAAGELSALLAKELGLSVPETLMDLGEGSDGDTLAALRRVQASAWTAIERLKEEHGADDQLLLVVPATTVQALVCRALTMPVEDYQRFRIDHGSLTIIDFRVQQNRTILLSLNETCHIAALTRGE